MNTSGFVFYDFWDYYQCHSAFYIMARLASFKRGCRCTWSTASWNLPCRTIRTIQVLYIFFLVTLYRSIIPNVSATSATLFESPRKTTCLNFYNQFPSRHSFSFSFGPCARNFWYNGEDYRTIQVQSDAYYWYCYCSRFSSLHCMLQCSGLIHHFGMVYSPRGISIERPWCLPPLLYGPRRTAQLIRAPRIFCSSGEYTPVQKFPDTVSVNILRRHSSVSRHWKSDNPSRVHTNFCKGRRQIKSRDRRSSVLGYDLEMDRQLLSSSWGLQ